MSGITDAEEYEKDFLERFIKANASKKIDQLKEKLQNCEDAFERLKIQEKIKKVEKATEKELEELKDGDKHTTKVELGQKDEKLKEYDEFRNMEYNSVKIPLNIWQYLFEYQRDGVKWMIDLFHKAKGGVLADEMGLGKTIQICTFIVSLYNSNLGKDFLILCPATLIDHWENQLKQLQPIPKIHRHLNIKSEGIFILSYESFRNIPILKKFTCVFLDEGHKIKNKDSQIARSVKQLTAVSKFVISGTPIQNNLGELWSIFNFVNPCLLGPYTTFNDEFLVKINNFKTERDKEISYNYSVMLRSIIDPFILRRTKNMINHKLPGKLDKVVFVSLTDEQVSLYKATLESNRFKNLIKNRFKGTGSLLSAICYLRNICNHPLLIKNTTFDTFKVKEAKDLSLDSLEQDEFSSDFDSDGIIEIESSAKMKITLEFLEKWHKEGKKVLLFFQTVKMLNIAAMTIQKYCRNYKFMSMTGSTPISQRTKLIDNFNIDKEVFLFLLTTRVGGLGLNLASANRVIIYDPDWNPSMDTQAKERIYRFGQKTEVEIYRLITRDTIEEKIYQKQIYKDCLSKKILSNPETIFDKNYFFDLFSFSHTFEKSAKVENDKNYQIQNDELVEVREEDKKNFEILKKYNEKEYLTGKELIEYILRRESDLS